MSNPLEPDVHWNTKMKLDLAHLERCCMPMPHQVTDQSSIFVDAFGPKTIRNPCCLYNGFIVAKVVDYAHKARIEHTKGVSQERIQTGDTGPREFLGVRI